MTGKRDFDYSFEAFLQEIDGGVRLSKGGDIFFILDNNRAINTGNLEDFYTTDGLNAHLWALCNGYRISMTEAKRGADGTISAKPTPYSAIGHHEPNHSIPVLSFGAHFELDTTDIDAEFAAVWRAQHWR